MVVVLAGRREPRALAGGEDLARRGAGVGRRRGRARRHFLVAARTAGVSAPIVQLLPLALVVLVAMGIPANVAGWGPREGVAAWAFAAVGLGAQQGLATAVVYGVMTFAAALPGLVVLHAGRERRREVGDAPVPEPVIGVAAEPVTGWSAVAERPYTLLSCALSLDGYLDSGTGERLLLSNEADLARVDARTRRLRRDPGRRDHGPSRRPAAAGAVRGAAGRRGAGAA